MKPPLWPLGVVSLALIGCATRPATRVYVLGTPFHPEPATREPGAAPRPQVYLSPVLLVDYLDTTDLTVRSGPHEIRALAGGQWAERLSEGITQTLAAGLAARLPGDAVTTDTPVNDSALRVLVNIEAFDVWPDGRCVLVARWLVRGGKSPEARRATFATAAAAPGAVSPEVIVTSMEATVGKLGDAIAAGIPADPPNRAGGDGAAPPQGPVR